MITLNEIAYNIKNLAYGGKNSTENNISTSQIKHWIHYHRAKLIADNIDKGISNNESLYQNMDLTIANSAQPNISEYWMRWYNYATGKFHKPNDTDLHGFFINIHPKNSSYLYGEWLAESVITNPDPPNYPDQGFSNRNGWYGENDSSLQNRGDYRNYGNHKFFIPRPLQLKNDAGIKDVRVTREPHFPYGTSMGQQVYKTDFISLYRKEFNDYDKYNKFTNHKHPYYTQEVAAHGTRIISHEDDGSYSLGGDRQSIDTSNKSLLSLEQLQVTPNYHAGLESSGENVMYWKYLGKVSAVLENPTNIETMWSLQDMRRMVYLAAAETHPISDVKHLKWDDAKNPYPIPMEYVSDLIQRVVQIELQAELKTKSDEITDGLDDNMKRSGVQVQR